MENLILREFQSLSKINHTLLLILGVGFSVFSQCDINPIGLDLGPDLALCEGDAIEFRSNIHDNLGEFKFEWTSSKNEVFNTKSILVTDSGYYFFTVENTSGCIESDTVYVSKEEIPYLEIQNRYKICDGDTLKVLNSINTKDYFLDWVDGSVESDNIIVNPGNYEFIISNVNCINIQNFEVELHKVPKLDDLYLCEDLNESIYLDSIDLNIFQFEHIVSGDIFRDYIFKTGQYRGVTNEGCVIETLKVKEKCPFNLYVPNTITPNGDGVNDELEIYYSGLLNLDLVLFNRWGGKLNVYKSSPSTWTFDTFPQGIYPWLITYEILTEGNQIVRRYKRGVLNVIR